MRLNEPVRHIWVWLCVWFNPGDEVRLWISLQGFILKWNHEIFVLILVSSVPVPAEKTANTDLSLLTAGRSLKAFRSSFRWRARALGLEAERSFPSDRFKFPCWVDALTVLHGVNWSDSFCGRSLNKVKLKPATPNVFAAKLKRYRPHLNLKSWNMQ